MRLCSSVLRHAQIGLNFLERSYFALHHLDRILQERYGVDGFVWCGTLTTISYTATCWQNYFDIYKFGKVHHPRTNSPPTAFPDSVSTLLGVPAGIVVYSEYLRPLALDHNFKSSFIPNLVGYLTYITI